MLMLHDWMVLCTDGLSSVLLLGRGVRVAGEGDLLREEGEEAEKPRSSWF